MPSRKKSSSKRKKSSPKRSPKKRGFAAWTASMRKRAAVKSGKTKKFRRCYEKCLSPTKRKTSAWGAFVKKHYASTKKSGDTLGQTMKRLGKLYRGEA